MIYLVVASGVLTCGAAIGAIRAARLLTAVLWLALASAMLSMLLYSLSAPEIAVVELSIGAGLVTVLFVFSLNLVGERSLERGVLLPRPLAWVSVLGVALTLTGLILRLPGASPQVSEPSFSIVLWQNRALDVLIQIPLLFAGMLGVLGLLAEGKPRQIPALTEVDTRQPECQPEPVEAPGVAEPVEELTHS
jgi:NADH:ubiquinone oxidoreductase subunit 6 (subunit J)